MKKVLLIGAGKSTPYLIKYLMSQQEVPLSLTITDINTDLAQRVAGGQENVRIVKGDIFEAPFRQKLVSSHDLVISMLPAHLHMEVAKDALAYGKHFVTASYISEGMKSLDGAVKDKGLVFLNEMGLDPGIDHMSAMQTIDKLKEDGARILLFESFTGGLVAPESEDNLWQYKFTWNPRNVVLAGQGGVAKFLHAGDYKYIPYHKLFRRTEFLNIEEYGMYEAYPNRDSLRYRLLYGLEETETFYRGTIRRPGFSRAWNVFVQLGMTDDTYVMEDSENLTPKKFVESFVPFSPHDTVQLRLKHYLGIPQDDEIWLKLEELDLFNDEKKLGLKNATPAQLLQKILEEKWAMKPGDKDMIIMYHRFGYAKDDTKKQIDSFLVVKGEDNTYTAMAKTVGLPLGIAAVKILKGEIHSPGVLLPVKKEIYEPVLQELGTYGIRFREKDVPFTDYKK